MEVHFPGIAKILGTFALVGLTYTVALGIYRLYLHPIAHFPGPKLAALTKWYELYFDLVKGHGGQFMWEIQRMHKVYGPVVRINPDELHIEDPDYFEVLYAGAPAKRDKWPPAAKMAGTPLGTFGAIEYEVHRKRRVASSQFFSISAIDNAENLLGQQVQILCDNLHTAHTNSNILDLRVCFLAFATDTVTRYALGDSFNLQTNAQAAQAWFRTIDAIQSATPMVKQFPWIMDIVDKLPVVVLQFIAADLSRVVEHNHAMSLAANKFVSSYQSKGQGGFGEKEHHRTLFQCILESNVPASYKAPARIAQEASTTISAGSSTAAHVLAMVVFHVHDNKDVLKKLRKEIDNAIPNVNRIPAIKETSALPYLTAVIKESLRITGLITSRSPLCTPTDLVYKQWVIPAGTPTSLSGHDVLLSSQAYHEPHKFNPDRWLGGNSNAEKYFVPFGRGTRNCIGMRFAMVEMNLAIASIIRRFDLELYDTTRERDIDIIRDCFVGEAHPSSLGVRVRVIGLRS